MNAQVLQILVGALAVIVVGAIAAYGTYWVARRQSSGTIKTSDASDLWAESQAMRAELRTEVIGLREEIVVLNKELRDLRVEMRALRKRLVVSEARIETIGDKSEADIKRVEEAATGPTAEEHEGE
jgi:predicted  nucleic acid-binding Zn-ribbon protein